jgi:hypothetical protein
VDEQPKTTEVQVDVHSREPGSDEWTQRKETVDTLGEGVEEEICMMYCNSVTTPGCHRHESQLNKDPWGSDKLVPPASPLQAVRKSQDNDSFCAPRIRLLEKGEAPDDMIERREVTTDRRQYAMIRGVLHVIESAAVDSGGHRRVAKLVVPRDLKTTLTLSMHRDPLTMAYFGHEKTYKKVSQRIWWQGMYAETEWIIGSCPLCARMKRGRRTARSHLQCMPSGAIGDTVGIDWTGPIGVGPTKLGNHYALTIVDWFFARTRMLCMQN